MKQQQLLLMTSSPTLLRHWNHIAPIGYTLYPVESPAIMFDYLKNYPNVIVMLDEESCEHLEETLRALGTYQQTTVLLFHHAPDAEHAASLLKYGILGYENSFLSAENLALMLQVTQQKHTWFFPKLMQHLINTHPSENGDMHQHSLLDLLSPQESSIALQISKGYTNKEIAESHHIALSTVKNHIRHIFEKTGFKDRFSLALALKEE